MNTPRTFQDQVSAWQIAQQYRNGYEQGRDDAYRAVLASGPVDAFVLVATAASIARGDNPATLQVHDKDAT